jgi:RNA polymerase sigma-70 factor (ECF subfamily)
LWTNWLDTYYLWHAVRADLLRRLGRVSDAAPAYESAIERTRNEAERALLGHRAVTGCASRDDRPAER